MHISNPITPRSSELRQCIVYAKHEIARIREYRDDAPACLWEHLNNSLDTWLIKLAEYQKEYMQIEESECTCNPINGTACPSCVESNKVRYPVIPIEGEL